MLFFHSGFTIYILKKIVGRFHFPYILCRCFILFIYLIFILCRHFDDGHRDKRDTLFSFDWHWFNNYWCGLSIHVLLLFYTLWIQSISWNWPLETWRCLEFFSDEIPQDISWGQMSFKTLSNLWLFGALQHLFYGFPAHSVVKESTCNAGDLQETWAGSLGSEDSLKKEMANHSSILAWRIPWASFVLAGYSPWGCKESDRTDQLSNKNCTSFDM